jgi:hypothetical protein
MFCLGCFERAQKEDRNRAKTIIKNYGLKVKNKVQYSSEKDCAVASFSKE